MTYYSTPPRSDELYHYGIKGMKWGVRRYENEDGTFTPEGKRRYDAYNKHEKLKNKAIRERYKLLGQNAKLRSDFGDGSDDDEWFEMHARRAGLDTTAYNKAVKENSEFFKNNKKLIRQGEKLKKRMDFNKLSDLEKKAIIKKRNKSIAKSAAALAAVAAILYGTYKYNEAKDKKRSEAIDNYYKRLDRWKNRASDAYSNVLYKNTDLARRGEITINELLRRADKRDTQYQRIRNKISDASKLTPDQIVKIMKKAK